MYLLIEGQALGEIRHVLGEDAVSTDDEILLAHGYSEWATVNTERLPIAVVYPKSTVEVSQIAKICHRYRVPSMHPLHIYFPAIRLKITASSLRHHLV